MSPSRDAVPLLVLLPGLDGTGVMFEPLMAALGPGLETRVVRYPSEVTSYAEAFVFVQEHLPKDRPFVLLGESFSGPVALTLAAARSAGMVGLVLCCTFAGNPRPGFRWARGLLSMLPPRRLSMGLIRLLLLGRWGSKALLDLALRMRGEVPSHTLRQRLLAVLEIDVTSLLSRIEVPALALCASADGLVPFRATAHIQAHLPALDITVIPGPHWLLQARPEEAAGVIRAFFHHQKWISHLA